MSDTNIEWADKVWNSVTGCTKVSDGCRNCYAERMSKRLAGRAGYPEDGFNVTLHPDKLDEPLRWKKPARIFVCSMGDLFHEDVPDEFIDKVWMTFIEARHHTFLVLTKRPERMMRYGRKLTHAGWVGDGSNVWLGTSVEDQKTADERMPLLLQTPAAKRFVSYEPALGPVDFTRYLRIAWQCSYCSRYYPDPLKEVCPDCGKRGGWTGSHIFNPPGGQRGSGLDWLIMGGESGPGARPLHPDWARSVRDQCQAAGVPFFFKQWGEWTPNVDDVSVHYKNWGQFSKITGQHGRVRFDWQGVEDCDILIARVGKARAGCLLDGKEHKERP